MTNKLLFRLPDRFALYRVIGRVIGRVLWSRVPALLVTVSFTSLSLAQEPVFSNDSMQWEGPAVTEAAATANEFDQDRGLLALEAARNLGARNTLLLPEPDADEVARRMTPTDDTDRQPKQIGFTREVTGFAQLPPSPAGTRLGSDGRDYAVSQRLLGSAGAVSIRLHFSNVVLPAGARLYVYGLADGAQPKGYDSAWLGDRTSFWSHTVSGDRAVVEYHTPLDHGTTDGAASYTVDQVVHNVVGIFGHVGAAVGAAVSAKAAAACHLDMCNNQAWQAVGNGVMRLTFVSGHNTYDCSGALLNDQAGSGTPYIYTANHCISTQAEAATVELAYFYQRNSCADNPSSNTVTRLGSTLLVTGGAGPGNADFTLLRASTSPPSGVTFLGWTTNSIATGSRVTGIHHPGGNFKRISFGVKEFNNPKKHIFRWSSGAIEFGSSGSPGIINGPGRSSAQVIGTLSEAPQPFCGTLRRSYYGKFSEAWPSFQRYLDPDNSDVPDMIVNNFFVVGSRFEPGLSFTVEATVRNRGKGTAAATTLRFVRSDDAVITADDPQLATAVVGVLAPHGSSLQSAAVSIANAGVYWIGACVSTADGETATGNNCSSGVQIPVTGPALPDLTVDNVSVSTPTPAPGTNFTINATVRNSGNKAAATTTLRYYRSNDNTIERTDTPLGTDTVAGLAPGGSSSESAPVAIANTGVYWVGACVDTANGETETDNNCSSGVQVTVTAPALPDLTVDNVSVSTSTPAPGATFTINATVRNSGDGAAAATTLRYYVSNVNTIGRREAELTTDAVDGLASGGSSSESAPVSIGNIGVFWVRACVDTANGETETDNNCSSSVRVTVTALALPDLTVDNVSVSTSTPAPGATFTINATVRNSGDGAAAATTLRYYVSNVNTIGRREAELTTDAVDGLAPGGSSSESAPVSIGNIGVFWVRACVDTANGETETDNNCSSSVRVTVTAPALPDLTVGNVSVSSTTPAPDATFTINATVRNSGDGAAAATTLHYYRSNDNTIGRSDTELTTDAVAGLASGGSSSESAQVSIANTGVYWVGACVDTANGETANGNNCSSGVQVTVTAPALPDLTVDNVSVSTSTPAPGATFTINATVRNSGTGAAAATTLHYYVSNDNTIGRSDTELTTDAVVGLASGGSSSESAPISIANTGVYWVGACVDTANGETETDNNCSSGVQVTVTALALPDLTVGNVSVSSTTPAPGATFTINATVRNSGTGAAAATTLHYYVSNDNTIGRSDTELTTDAVVGLASGGSSSESAPVSIANTGVYWVGACVDTASGETANGNNCSSGVQVTVTAPALPDLTVGNVSVSSTTPAPDATFTINATVRNSGTGAAAATTLHYYRSNDNTIGRSDTELTTDAVAGLASGGSSSESAPVSIANTGVYWVGACVDTASGETANGNNCSSGVQVTVTAPALPDLTVGNVSVSSTTPAPDATFTINATVRNSGTGAAAATTLHYYRSNDSTIGRSDTELTTDAVVGLASGGSSSESAPVSIANTGVYWVGACVDTASGETANGNNCSSGVQVTVTAPALPDLTVDNVSVSSTTPAPGATFTINATVRNSGTGAAAATTLHYYRSNDSTIGRSDTELTTDAVAGLASGGSSSESAPISIANTGVYWVGACVDTVNGETATRNNCSTGVQVTVTALALPDLTVDNVSVSSTTPAPGATFTINATVRNSGTGAAAATTLHYYRSNDNTIGRSDTELTTDAVDGLASGGSSSESAPISIADAGVYWVGACVDTVNRETATRNNCSSGVQVTVTARPDLTVDEISVAESSVEASVAFTINATVQNQGTGASVATTLRYYGSDDSTITASDTELASEPVAILAADASLQQRAEVLLTNAGTWWVGACVVEVNDEIVTDNNCSTGVQVTVTTLPDLTVDGISVAESSVEASVAFTINATVQNQGTGASVATRLRYYGSDDSTITVSDTELASESVATLAADASSQQSAEVLLTDAGIYWVGACVVEVNDETATDNNCSSGVQVTVTARPDNNNGHVILPAIIHLLLDP